MRWRPGLLGKPAVSRHDAAGTPAEPFGSLRGECLEIGRPVRLSGPGRSHHGGGLP